MLRIGESAATQSSYRRKRRYRRFSKSEITTFVSFVAFCKNSLRCIHLSFYRRKRSQGRACIPTERKFKLRFPPPEFFTEGNEGGSGPAKYNLCFLRYLLFKIFSDASSRPSAENLFLQKETKVTKVFAAGQEQSLCFLRYLLFKIFSDASLRPSAENLFLQKETKVTKVFAAGQEQSLCFLRYLVFKIFSDASTL